MPVEGVCMTTKSEYAEAAKWIQTWQVDVAEDGMVPTPYILAVRVLRQLAEGAVLCEKVVPTFREPFYRPIEEQPTAATETALWSRDIHEQ